MSNIPKYDELGTLSDEKLVARYNEIAANTIGGASFYLDELARRQLKRQYNRMLMLTIAIAVLTSINVLLVGYQYFVC